MVILNYAMCRCSKSVFAVLVYEITVNQVNCEKSHRSNVIQVQQIVVSKRFHIIELTSYMAVKH